MIWGLCGASTIAAEHMIPAIRANGDEIAWIVSGAPGRARAYAAEHQIGCGSASLGGILAQEPVEAVYISSTNEKHRTQALAALAAGKHVLCEKPLSMTIAEATEMVAAADAAHLVFGTNHHLRCAGSHRAIRELIASGRIGRVLSMRVHHAVHLPAHLQGWRINDAAAGGGVIPDITVHDADTVRFLLGEDPLDVVAQAISSGMGHGVEDSVMSIWTMPSAAMIFAHESFTHQYAGTGVEIHGTIGSIFARGVMTQAPIGSIELVTESGCESVPFSDHDLYGHAVRQFADAAAGKDQPAADGRDGVKSLAVALAVKEAALTGTRVRVDYGDLK